MRSLPHTDASVSLATAHLVAMPPDHAFHGR
jgi:hypothetical protein